MSKTAVITGATSGIGAAYAKRFAADGYNLILTGRRKEIIESLADDLRKKHNVPLDVILAELSDDNDVQKVVDAIDETDNIEVLINNAGYSGYSKEFLEVETTHYEEMIKVHQVVPLRLIAVAAPAMVRRGSGAIINVSSMAAYAALPKTGVYAGTKAFLKLFSEGLHHELRGRGVRVQVFCAGMTDTNCYKPYWTEEERAKLYKGTKPLMMSPEAAVDHSLRCLKKNRVVCIPGWRTRMVFTILRMMPRRLYYYVTAKMTDYQPT